MSQSSSIPNDQQLKEKWNEFAADFQTSFEPNTMNTALTLLTFLKIHSQEEQKFLEVGCGAGGTAYLAHTLMGANTSITCLDLSPDMLALAKNRLEKSECSSKSRVQFVEGSFMSLSFENSSFDKLLGNYCLHLVPDPNVALKEAKRVLKSGGMATFSVWGRPAHSPKFTIPPKVLETLRKEGKIPSDEAPAVRSPFHLSDLEKSKQMILDAGFKKCYGWYQKEVFDVASGEEYSHRIVKHTPSLRKLVSSLNDQQQQLVYSKLEEEANSFLSKGEPICNEVLILVGFV